MTAGHIVPLVIEMRNNMTERKLQAVFNTTTIAWFTSCPECEIPGTAVDPFPGALHLQVVASQPCYGEACSVYSLPEKVEGGIRVDRGQVASFLPAEVFRVSPGLLVGAPQVAVLPVLLPVLFAGFDACVVAAS